VIGSLAVVLAHVAGDPERSALGLSLAKRFRRSDTGGETTGSLRFAGVQKHSRESGNCFDIRERGTGQSAESERTTGTIALFGMASPGLSAAI
jgi:hypothetical protein